MLWWGGVDDPAVPHGSNAKAAAGSSTPPYQFLSKIDREIFPLSPHSLLMKFAFFLTSFDHPEELTLYASFLEKNSTHLKEAEIILYCNNPNVSNEALHCSLSTFKANQTHLIRSTQNAGWQFGSFEGMVQNYDLLRQYDLVIHSHQNVYPVRGQQFLLLLQHFAASEASLLCAEVERVPSVELASTHPNDPLLYCTDFFAFKPNAIPKEVFDAYRSMDPQFTIAESFLKITAQRHQIPVLIFKRFLHNLFHRELDYVGLWHEHDQARVAGYLADPDSTTLYEFDLTDLPMKKPNR